MKLRALRAEHLDRVYRGMEAAGYRPKTVRHVHIAAHRALRDAVTRGYLERNPAEHANPPRQSATRSHDAVERAWDADQLAGFLAATAERRDA